MIRFLLSAWGIAAGTMLLIWLCYLVIHNPSIVDLGWVMSIAAIGVYAFMQLRSPTWVHWAFLGLLLAWTARLGGFLLYTRIIPGQVDPRYLALRNSLSAHEGFNFFLNYQLQALLVSSFAFALYATFSDQEYPRSVMIVAIALILTGIIGGAMADFHLYNFKASGAKGICEVGLWQYARHPNYFFELLIWLGFGITGIRTYQSMYSFITPISLWAIMYYVTIPLTERVSRSKREAYQDYIDRTNTFLPLPHKKK